MTAQPTILNNFRSRTVLIAFLSLSALVQPVFAVDGVIEINHATILQGNVTAGDTPGYPATISETGSYRLTGNLQMPDEDTGGIFVTAQFVSIDLNGFSIIGTTVCTGEPVTSCTPTGSGNGIRSLEDGTSISNGVVRGAGQFGIVINSDGGLIVGVRAQDNALSGLVISGQTNDDAGVIRNSISNRNGGDGFYLGEGGLATGNVAYGNGRHGLSATAGSRVVGNTFRSNFIFGLSMGLDTGFADNVMTENNKGNANPQTDGDGIEMGTNVCGTNTTCP